MRALALIVCAASALLASCYRGPNTCGIPCDPLQAGQPAGCPGDDVCTTAGVCGASMNACGAADANGTIDASVDAMPPPAQWTKVAIGHGYVCGISDGQMYCWGNNRFGQVDANMLTALPVVASPRLVPSPVGGTWIEVSASRSQPCGIVEQSDGNRNLVCWGNREEAETPSPTVPYVVSGTALADWRHLASGANATHTCAFNATTPDITCWGENHFAPGEPRDVVSGVFPAVDADVVDVRVGYYSTCVTNSTEGFNHTVTCREANGYQILTRATACTDPICEGAFGFGMRPIMAVGQQSACYVGPSAPALCQGTAQHGGLNGGAAADEVNLVSVNLPGTDRFIDIGVGDDVACGLPANVTATTPIRCWGDNSFGQLGNGLAGHSYLGLGGTNPGPVAVTLPEGEGVAIAVGGNDDTTPGTWPWIATANACAIIDPDSGASAGGHLYCWGDNTWGQLGIGRIGFAGAAVEVPKPAGGTGNWRAVSAGIAHTCASYDADKEPTTADQLFCWGRNDRAQTTQGPLTAPLQASSPAAVTLLSNAASDLQLRTLVGSGDHTCLIGYSGLNPDGPLVCWGRNDRKQIRDVPPPALNLLDQIDNQVRTVGSFDDGNGSVTAWGRDRDPVMHFASEDTSYASPTGFSEFLEIATLRGRITAVGHTEAGAAQQVFDGGSDEVVAVPSGEDWFSPTRSYQAACLIQDTDVNTGTAGQGRLHCFRSATEADVYPDILTDFVSYPTLSGPPLTVDNALTASADRWTAVAAQEKTACAINVSGANTRRVWCWGQAVVGEHGASSTLFANSSTTYDRHVYVQTPDPGAPRIAPVKTLDGNDVAAADSVAVGLHHACAIDSDGARLLCWGSNSNGQLGVGDAHPAVAPGSNLPQRVNNPPAPQ